MYLHDLLPRGSRQDQWDLELKADGKTFMATTSGATRDSLDSGHLVEAPDMAVSMKWGCFKGFCRAAFMGFEVDIGRFGVEP